MHCYAIGFGTDHGTVAAAPIGTGRWRSSACGRRTTTATSNYAMRASVPRFMLGLRDAR